LNEATARTLLLLRKHFTEELEKICAIVTFTVSRGAISSDIFSTSIQIFWQQNTENKQ
jgi:hypothetical protein